MVRARGLVLGGGCFATLAGLTIAVSSGSLPAPSVVHAGRVSTAAGATLSSAVTAIQPGSRTAGAARARTLAFVGAASAVTHSGEHLDADQPLIPSQEVDGVSPNAGAAGPGGEQGVIITGSGFTGVTDVSFGSGLDVTNTSYPCLPSTAGCFTVVSDTEIDADTPEAPLGTGTVDVIVTGGSANGPADDYSYFDPPTVTNVTPGSVDQGSTGIAVAGTNFSYPDVTPLTSGVSEVDLNPTSPGSTIHITNTCTGSQPNCFDFEDDSDLTFNLPNSVPAGTYDVQVITPGGTSATGSADILSVLPPTPTLTSLTPPSGSTAGGNNVVLAGTDFTGATDVHFGSDDITNVCGTGTCFSIDSDTQITVDNVPANTAGPVIVNVTTPSGTSNNKTYTYVTPTPTLTSLAPPSGSTLGGNDVTLTGTDFTGATDVNWGSTDISACGTGMCFNLISDTSIMVDNVPADGPGPINVSVTTPGGTSNNKTYTYVTPTPTLTSLAPPSGSTLGGNSVVLTGADLTGATDVNWGTVEDINTECGVGTCFTINSDTQITVDGVPANGPGPVNVTVTTPGGTSGPVTYTYVEPPPTLTSLLPTSGSTAGKNPVVLTGTSFTGATDVHVGADDLTPCPSSPCFTVNSDTQITVVMPPNVPGIVNVNVTTPSGTTTSLQYTYVAPAPTVTTVSPNEGAPAGGNIVTLTGTAFEAAGTPIISQVTVGVAPIVATPCGMFPTTPCFTVNSTTSITIGYLPSGTGVVNITVTNPSGTSPASSGNTYTYNASLPTVTDVLPKDGAAGGGAAISVLGSGFGQAGQDFVTDVFFGNTDVQDSFAYPCPSSSNGCFIVVGPTQLAVYTPAHAAGTIDVTVQTGLGVSDKGATDKYTFVAPGAYTPLTPYRICDTRPPGGGVSHNQCNTGVGSNKTLGTNGAVTAQITSTAAGQVPIGAQAVVVNVTAIDHSATSTFVTAYPAGAQRPNASNINLSGGKVGTNLVIVQLSASGQITLFNSIGSTDVIVDVQGYFGTPPSGTAGQFHSIAPLRICDSRADKDTECAGTTNNPLIGGHWRDVVLSGGVPVGIPTTPGEAAAAVFNLTAVGGTAPTTFLSVTPALANKTCPASAPTFSNLNPAEGTALPNRVISELGPNQDVCIYTAAGDINFIIDVNGWFGSSTAPAGVLFYSIPPTRVCDTRRRLEHSMFGPIGVGAQPRRERPDPHGRVHGGAGGQPELHRTGGRRCEPHRYRRQRHDVLHAVPDGCDKNDCVRPEPGRRRGHREPGDRGNLPRPATAM